MCMEKFRYIYGPVFSWRLGNSLGIDLLSGRKKICSFDCLYCQLGREKPVAMKRKQFVSTDKVIKEIKLLPDVSLDYITFSGRGEPTLAVNLGKTITAIKKIRKEPVCVLTNSTLLYLKSVREDLSLADFVVAKLDADTDLILNAVNHPVKTVHFNKIIDNIKRFKMQYHGKFALQVMFMRENKSSAETISLLAADIAPDEVQICTPVRTCSVKALSRGEIIEIKKKFHGMKVVSFYDVKKQVVIPVDVFAAKRRGREI